MYLMDSLTHAHSPSYIHTESRTVTGNATIQFDLKGSCFINWFLGTTYEQFFAMLLLNGARQLQVDDWFVFMDVSIRKLNIQFAPLLDTSHYLKVLLLNFIRN